MSSTSIFRQLTTGVTFNTKRFSQDAEKFGLTKTDIATEPAHADVKLPNFADIKSQVKLDKSKAKQRADERSDVEEEDILLLGKTKTTKLKKLKKKQKGTKAKAAEIYDEKLNQFKNANKITTDGTDVPDPIDDWSRLSGKYNVSENILENIKSSGFVTPTAVQMQAVPLMLEGRELLACAPTGSGKTAAFLVPIIHHLREPRKGGYRAVIVVPTKELATQIHRECVRLVLLLEKLI